MYVAVGLALFVAGAAIMTFVTATEDARTDGFNISGMGWTLLVGGAVTLILALIHWAGRQRRELRIERRPSADNDESPSLP